MGLTKSLVEITHDEGYGDDLLLHTNNAFRQKDMRADRIVTAKEPLVEKGDWIIKCTEGGFLRCSPETFQATFEAST